jgi:hypothetical protein
MTAGTLLPGFAAGAGVSGWPAFLATADPQIPLHGFGAGLGASARVIAAAHAALAHPPPTIAVSMCPDGSVPVTGLSFT